MREFSQNRRGLFLRPDDWIGPAIKNPFRDMIENLKSDRVEENRKTIFVILQTPGGSAEIIEKLIEILWHHTSL